MATATPEQQCYVTGELDGGPPVLQAGPRLPGMMPMRSRPRMVEHQIYPVAVNWHLGGRLTWSNGDLLKDGMPVPTWGELWENAS